MAAKKEVAKRGAKPLYDGAMQAVSFRLAERHVRKLLQMGGVARLRKWIDTAKV